MLAGWHLHGDADMDADIQTSGEGIPPLSLMLGWHNLVGAVNRMGGSLQAEGHPGVALDTCKPQHAHHVLFLSLLRSLPLVTHFNVTFQLPVRHIQCRTGEKSSFPAGHLEDNHKLSLGHSV